MRIAVVLICVLVSGCIYGGKGGTRGSNIPPDDVRGSVPAKRL
jgi:hypothetical protein